MNIIKNKHNPGKFAFIDASNIIYGCKTTGWKMDFEKLVGYLKTRYEISRIFYYAGLNADNKKQILFYEALQRLGYELRLVPVKTFKDGRKKADVDARLTFEAMKYLDEYDEAIFLTGDGDYYWLLEYLLQNGKKIRLISHRESTARELRQLFGGKFTDLSRLKEILRFKEKEKNTADALEGIYRR